MPSGRSQPGRTSTATAAEPVGIKGTFIEPTGQGRIRIKMDDGTVLDAGPPEPPDDARVEAQVLCEIDSHVFERCPICDCEDLTDEHVPPASIGGRIRTRTCGPCNNDLGARVEADLSAWFRDQLVQVRFEHESVRGSRVAAPINILRTTDGAVVMAMDGGDKAIPAMLDAGREVQVEYQHPDPARYEVALLKQAYLTACIHLGEVPAGAAADAVRTELMAARDTTVRDRLPLSPIAAGLHYGRSYDEPSSALYLASVTAASNEPMLAVVMGNLWASWPIDDPEIIKTAIALAEAPA